MKKFLVFLFIVFVSINAFANKINWHADGTLTQTTCASGDNITPPTAPSKRGYHFTGWTASDNLFDISAIANNNSYTIVDDNTFIVEGYPGTPISLKKVAPSLAEGDTITITGDSTSVSRTVYLSGTGSTLTFGQQLTITANILNGNIAFYGMVGGGAATITNLRITKE